MSGSTYDYDAFISYRHTEPDITIAKRLLELLENYRPPKSISRKSGIKRLGKIFRDREELPTTTDLSESIKEALNHSKYLIVICSPRTPESEWIRKEIEIFKAVNGVERIQAILIEGEPEDSFPEPLFYEKKIQMKTDGKETEVIKKLELLAADIRPDDLKGKPGHAYGISKTDDKKLLSQACRLLKVERLRCLAPMIGCKFDELYQRHARRMIRNIAAAAVSIVSLLGLFTAYSININLQLSKQKDIAEKQAVIAGENEREAKAQRDQALMQQSLYLSNLSVQELENGDRLMSKMLALYALPKDINKPDRPFSEEAIYALHTAMLSVDNKYTSTTIINNREKSSFRDAVFSPDDSRIIALDINCNASVWDSSDGEFIFDIKEYNSERFPAYNSIYDGKYVLTSLSEKVSRLWEAATGNIVIDVPYPIDSIIDLTFSKDGSRLALRLADDTWELWDIGAAARLCKLDRSYGDIFGVIYSPDGSFLLAYMTDKPFMVFNPENGARIAALDTESGRACVSSDGKYAVTTSWAHGNTGSVVSIWNTSDWTKMSQWVTGLEDVNYVELSPDGKYLLAALSNSTAVIYDTMTGIVVNEIENNVEYEPNFSPDGTKVIVCSSHIGIWDIEKNAWFDDLAVYKDITNVRFSHDGKMILSICDNGKQIKVWNLTENIVEQGDNLAFEDKRCYVSASGQYLLAVDPDFSLEVWDTDKRIAIASMDGLKNAIGSTDPASVDFFISNDGERVALEISGTDEVNPNAFTIQEVQIWDVRSGRRLYGYKGDNLYEDFFIGSMSPDLNYITTQTGLTDWKKGREIPDADEWIKQRCFSSQGDYIVNLSTTGDLTARDITTMNPVFTAGNVAKLLSNCFTEEYGAVISNDGYLRIYNINNGSTEFDYKALYGIEYAAFSPDGRFLCVSSNNDALLWETGSWRLVAVLSGHSSYIRQISFSPDNQYVITASYDRSAIVWKTETGKKVVKLSGFPDFIGQIAFSKDMTGIITVLENRIATIWTFCTDPQNIIDRARNEINGREFTGDEKTRYFID